MKLIAHIETIRKEVDDMLKKHELTGSEWVSVNDISIALDKLEQANKQKLKEDSQG
jgi:hypothetical protein